MLVCVVCVVCLCLLQVPISLCPHLGPVAVGSLSLFLVTQPQECRERGALRSVDWCTVCVHCMCVSACRGGFYIIYSVCEGRILVQSFSQNCVVNPRRACARVTVVVLSVCVSVCLFPL